MTDLWQLNNINPYSVNPTTYLAINEINQLQEKADSYVKQAVKYMNDFSQEGHFIFDEEAYTSELLNAIFDKITNILEVGGTGLLPEIEIAIWNREEERAKLVRQEMQDKINSDWAAKGFSLPDGVLTSLHADLYRNYQDSRLTTSRDIAIKQAELEQKNIFSAIENAGVMTKSIFDSHSQMMERKFNTAKENSVLFQEIAKGMSAIFAQLAASCYSAGNVGISGSGSESQSQNLSLSGSSSVNVNYSDNRQESTSYNESKNTNYNYSL